MADEERIASELAAFKDPVKDSLRKSIIQEATHRGGKTLALFRTAHGHMWADPAIPPTVRTIAEAASELGIPRSQAETMYHETMAAAIASFRESAEYRAWTPPGLEPPPHPKK